VSGLIETLSHRGLSSLLCLHEPLDVLLYVVDLALSATLRLLLMMSAAIIASLAHHMIVLIVDGDVYPVDT
jgi:hypothetical protein